jgi:hypothetical protein
MGRKFQNPSRSRKMLLVRRAEEKQLRDSERYGLPPPISTQRTQRELWEERLRETGPNKERL